MQLRGIGDVVAGEDLIPGRFYRTWRHNGATTFFQVVEEKGSAGVSTWALDFRVQSDGGARLDEIYRSMMFVEVPDVHLRIDSTSLAGDQYSRATSAGMLLVAGGAAVLLATPPRNYGWVPVDLTAGKVLRAPPAGWAWFSRWSLVAEDGDDERELIAYGLT